MGRKQKPITEEEMIYVFALLGGGASLRSCAQLVGMSVQGFKDRFEEEIKTCKEAFFDYGRQCVLRRLPQSDRLCELFARTQLGWKEDKSSGDEDLEPIEYKFTVTKKGERITRVTSEEAEE